MTKLERATALLPLVIKAQEKKHSIDFDISREKLDIWHWRYDKERVHITVTDNKSFDNAITYLKSL